MCVYGCVVWCVSVVTLFFFYFSQPDRVLDRIRFDPIGLTKNHLIQYYPPSDPIPTRFFSDRVGSDKMPTPSASDTGGGDSPTIRQLLI